MLVLRKANNWVARKSSSFSLLPLLLLDLSSALYIEARLNLTYFSSNVELLPSTRLKRKLDLYADVFLKCLLCCNYNANETIMQW